ncbi:MAG: tripartite tricarboxylate transporter TctB family protein [Geminicoccaceae bacterium]|nr:tripartite tricarboxylate transporter TctB family protein [Geminicoccaceae bacterium]
MRLGDGTSGVVVIAGAAAIAAAATTFPDTHGQAYGPDLFPNIIAAGFVLAGLLLIKEGWPQPDRGFTVSLEVAAGGGRPLDALVVIAAIVLFMVLTGPLGFVLTATLVTTATIAWFRRGHLLSAVLVSLVAALFIDYAFRGWLLVPLPQGPFDVLPW